MSIFCPEDGQIPCMAIPCPANGNMKIAKGNQQRLCAALTACILPGRGGTAGGIALETAAPK